MAATLQLCNKFLALFSEHVKITSMELNTYMWNLWLVVFGLLSALEYTIKAAMSKDGTERFVCFMLAYTCGLIGGWNLICLLVKLNVIHP